MADTMRTSSGETIYEWERLKARQQDSGTLKNWIWGAVSCGQPVPGCMSVDALRMVLLERGEDGSGYHGT